MATYMLEKSFASGVRMSGNVIAVSNMFGIGCDRDRRVDILKNVEVSIEAGDVVYITGGSGAGKSVVLGMLKEQLPEDHIVIDPSEEKLPGGRPLVDCFGDRPMSEILCWLSMAGLSNAFAILRSEDQLSDGQRYRFRLAMAMSKRPDVICIDEFCASLDRVTAAVVAHNVRKFADKFGTTFILATSHDDLLDDLRPNVVVVKHLGSGCGVYYPGRSKD